MNIRYATRLLAGFLSAALLLPAQIVEIDIPYERFVLPNGLRVIVHEDRKAPIVAVNVWYHVGSKNEPKGRSGFAHLFEHLMFNGSEHFNQDYFKVLEKLGATNLNGTTNEDRTNYFQNVPSSALDTVLWMESDRMGHLLGAIDQAKLDEQRGVVQNEKRQAENQPYGQAFNLITENTYPAGHPYSWTVIGSMEDLNAASLNDVKDWFKTYYGPSNAVVVLAGDIDAKTAKEKMERFFGAIPPGPPVSRHREWIAKMTGRKRQVMQDRVPQSRFFLVWNIPPDFTRETNLLGMAASILAQGKTSRMYRRLVYDEQWATNVSAFLDGREIGSQMLIDAMVRPGVDPARVEKAIHEELDKFLRDGPTPQELETVRTRALAGFLRGMERIGGFGGKSDILARGEVFANNPAAYKESLKNWQSASVTDVRDAARRWLSDGLFTLEVHPFPQVKAIPSGVDRSKVPEPGPPPGFKLPAIQRAKLSNGLQILLAERHETPIVNLNLLVDSGYASDQFSVPGTARLAMSMLDEGTRTRKSLEISQQIDDLGAQLSTGVGLDSANVFLSALKSKLDASLEIFADVILNPVFPQEDFAREQKLLLAAIQREKTEPFSIGLRVFPALMYGKNHAYGNPLTGSGTEASVKQITRETLAKFHQTWFKSNNATLVVAGDTTLAEITPKLEKLFAAWKPGEVPKKNLATVAHQPKPSVYLIDRPGSQQSILLAGHVAMPRNSPDEIAVTTLNTVLGGAFVSRLNMNLREDKHWSYGAQTVLVNAKGQGPFIALSPVQTDKTREALVEMNKELRQILRDKPVTDEELNMAKDNQTLRLPGLRETTNAVLSSMAELVTYGLPDDYWDTYTAKVRALTLKDMARAAEKLLRPDSLVWVVVGDRARIEAGVRELNLGELRYLDADGNPIQ